MAFLEVNALEKNWESCKVHVSFSLEKGEFLCIVGQSGSGKSTVLRMIAGILKSDSPLSKIFLDGKEITSLPPGKRDVGMVFQNGALFGNLNVVDNVSYGLLCRGVEKKLARKKAEEILFRMGLSGFEKRMPRTLSGGEAQRVALARTLIVSPKLVLLDEPLSAVDSALRKKLSEDIRAMQKEFGFTAIMITHDLAEAKSTGTRILSLSHGKKTWEGESAEFSVPETC